MLFRTGLNWFMGSLSRATCTVHSISAQTSQKGIKCTIAKEYIRSYCPNTYTVDLGHVRLVFTRLRLIQPKIYEFFFLSIFFFQFGPSVIIEHCTCHSQAFGTKALFGKTSIEQNINTLLIL